jgi:hypothetical protein
MLNIISKCIISKEISGPQKVVSNLIRGLDKIRYPNVINGGLDSCKRLWIADDTAALYKLKNLSHEIKVLVGPNLYTFPRLIPKEIDFSRAVFLNPSKWNKKAWDTFGFNKCPVAVWPAGIDTQEFCPSPDEKSFVLLYWKQRSVQERDLVIRNLESKKIKYRLIKYGLYTENEFKDCLKGAKYIIWLGRQESQGIALQEALSSNVPIMVCEPKTMGHWHAPKREMDLFNDIENEYSPVTAAEYFDERCGIKIYDLETQISDAIERMEVGWKDYKPREYIVENLSLEKQAKDLILLYEKYYNLKFEDGYNEKLLNTSKWINARAAFKSVYLFEKSAKRLLKKIINYNDI